MSTVGRRGKDHAASGIRDEWGSKRLNVDAYLARLGYDGDVRATEGTLHALHRTHAETIPFENLDIVMGQGISLDIDDVQDKLLRRPRGGYCFEHNLLFAALLERLGYRVRRLAARIQPSKPGPRGHMLVGVEADGGRWLADVGFGAGLLEPIPLDEGAASRQGDWRYGLGRREGGVWLLRSAGSSGWSDLYAFTLEPQHPIDYAVYNHFTSTHPTSPFVGQAVLIQTTPEVRHTLRDRELATVRPDGSTRRRELTDDEVSGILRETFGVILEPEELACLRLGT